MNHVTCEMPIRVFAALLNFFVVVQPRIQREWMNGMAHGKGVETFPDGSIRHDGMWVEDEPQLSNGR
jgi:MORN repeat